MSLQCSSVSSHPDEEDGTRIANPMRAVRVSHRHPSPRKRSGPRSAKVLLPLTAHHLTVNGLVGGHQMGNAGADGAGAMKADRVTAAASADTCTALRPLLSRAIKSLGKAKRHSSRK